MQTKQREKEDEQTKGREQLAAIIGKNVLRTLGQPGSLHRIQTKQLWENNYRVNIIVGEDAASVKVAHSYFLVVDGEGSILTSTPTIIKQY